MRSHFSQKKGFFSSKLGDSVFICMLYNYFLKWIWESSSCGKCYQLKLWIPDGISVMIFQVFLLNQHQRISCWVSLGLQLLFSLQWKLIFIKDLNGKTSFFCAVLNSQHMLINWSQIQQQNFVIKPFVKFSFAWKSKMESNVEIFRCYL